MPAAGVAGDTAGETAYRRIRHDILFGALRPGARLRPERLRGPYGASTSTLREILYRLSSEGLVVAEGQKGFGVSPVSVQNFREIAGMRQLLESHAIRESFRRGDVDWEADVVCAHHKLARLERRMLSGERGIAQDWKRYDLEFHKALISACGSQALMDVHAQVLDHYLRYQVIAVIFRGEVACEEHRQLRDTALARDADRASAILHAHVEACVDHAMQAGRLAGPCGD
ncbi:GntR family transcriptional regulator [Stappia sp.]|jgi:DNA-binding GntR family transcriptional regulator|uniref:GntR family transcriptional regulator n=1 Tax=Stappia sp. TaxID=1870903 RepID=UPI003D1110D4